MSTATIPPPIESNLSRLVALAQLVQNGQCAAITNVSWDDYEQLLVWRDGRYPRSMFLTYDQGRLEIMVITNRHERLKCILALLIDAWIEETGGEYLPSGQLTHKRADLKRGFEPDACYYIQNWKKVGGLRQIDFKVDPPPDLMIEVEVSRSFSKRLPIAAAFKIPEVWRYNGKRVTIMLFQPNGSYARSSISRAIPDFPFTDAPRFLKLAESIDVGFATIGREFRSWIRAATKMK